MDEEEDHYHLGKLPAEIDFARETYSLGDVVYKRTNEKLFIEIELNSVEAKTAADMIDAGLVKVIITPTPFKASNEKAN